MQLTRGLAGIVAAALLTGCDGDVVGNFTHIPVVPQPSLAGAVPPSANDTATGFYDFMQTITWSQNKTTVDMCTGPFSCFFGIKKVKVDLEVPQNSFLVDARAVSAGGVLLVRAVNKGHHATEHYNFRPGYIYTLVGYPNAPGDSLSHWILKETDTTTHHTVTVAGVEGPFKPCWDSPPATDDQVDLYKCSEAHASAALKKSAFGVFGFIEQLLAGGESPVWKSCPSGCCTLAQT